jgi:hypothetical protein
MHALPCAHADNAAWLLGYQRAMSMHLTCTQSCICRHCFTWAAHGKCRWGEGTSWLQGIFPCSAVLPQPNQLSCVVLSFASIVNAALFKMRHV